MLKWFTPSLAPAITVSLFAAFGFSTPLHASSLWQLEATTPPTDAADAADQTVAYQVQMNRQVLTGLQPGDQVELPLPAGLMQFTIEQRIEHPNGSSSVIGRLSAASADTQADIQANTHQANTQTNNKSGTGIEPTVQLTEPVLLTFSQHSLFAQINTAQLSYGLTGSPSQAVLQPINQHYAKPTNPRHDDVVLPPVKTPPDPLAKPQPGATAQPPALLPPTLFFNPNIRSDFPAEDNRQLATIDVLALYSQAAEDFYQGDVSTRIYHVFTVANQAFADSGAFIKLNPVRLQKIDPSQPEIQTHISEMSEQRNNFKQLSQWRRSSGADLVTLFTPSDTNSWYCGQAQVSVHNDNLRSQREAVELRPDQTHSAVHLNCHDDTFAHEMGHHLGLSHGNGRADKGYSFPYARGYFVHQDFSTIMVYSNLFATKSLLHFSNPARLCQGQVCGKPRDHADGADAVHALNKVRFMVADLHRQQPAGLTLDQVITQVDDPALKSCLIEMQQQIPQWRYASDVTTLGYYPLQGCGSQDPQQRLISDLTGLTLLPNLQGLSIHAGNITDFSPLTKLSALSELGIYGAKKVSEMPWLSQLPQLNALSLSQVNLGSTLHLQGLTRLRSLDLEFIGKVDNYAGLTGLTALESIEIFGSYSAPYFTDLSFLAGKPNLKTLKLHNSQIADLQPLNLLAPGQLETFDFASNQPINYQPLQQQDAISDLALYHSYRSDCTSLQQLIPKLTKLRVYQPPFNCKTSSPAIPVFAELPMLQYEANNFNGTMVTLPKVYAIDPEDGQLTATPDKLNYFPFGDSTIRWRVIDSGNNVVEALQQVRITDTTAPQIFGPAVYYYSYGENEAVPSDYTNQYGFYSRFYADDLVSGLGNLKPYTDDFIPMLQMRMEKPDWFAPGINQVTIHAKDHSGNESSMVSYFVNQMRDGPRISETAPLQLTMTDRSGISGQSAQLQHYLSTVIARDKQGRLLPVTAEVPSWLAPGRHYIPLTTRDAAGLIDQRLLQVEVGDFTGPEFAPLPPLVIVSAGSQGISANHPQLLHYLAALTANDQWSNPVRFQYQLAEHYTPGEYLLSINAVDAVGNSSNQQLTLKVVYQPRKRKLLKLLQMSANHR